MDFFVMVSFNFRIKKMITRAAFYLDINECIVQVNPCGEFQLCQNRIGSFACQCIAGLELNDDTQQCQGIS